VTRLHLPPRVAREIHKEKWEAQRAHQRATVERLLDFDDPVCREWRPVLEQVDPYLRLGRARPQAYEPEFNVRPGFYHWVRMNPTAAPTVEPITGPDGESFTEPDSSLLDRLRGNDLQDPRAYAALIAKHEQRELAREREQEADREEINREVLERWAAASRTQVLVSDDVPWTQNAAGRRARNN
jgi:hypothetical protein